MRTIPFRRAAQDRLTPRRRRAAKPRPRSRQSCHSQQHRLSRPVLSIRYVFFLARAGACWRVLALGRSQTMVSRNEWNCQISGRRHHARLLRAAPGVESGDRFGSEAVRGVSDTGQWPSRRRPTLAVSQGAHWMRAGCVSLASCFGPGASGGPRSGLRRSGTRARPGSTAR